MAARKGQGFSVATTAVLALSSTGLVAASPGFVALPIEKRSISRLSGLRRRDPHSFTMANEAFQYTTNVSLGTPPQTVKVQVDTGSSDLVIFAPNSCDPSYSSCIPTSYDPSKSSTSNLIGSNLFQTRYGDGSGATGDFYNDTLKINDLTVNEQVFGLATETKGLQIGLIGLGYDTDESFYELHPDRSPYPSFLDSLVNQSVISNKAYSMWLDAVESPTGQVLLGGYDTSRYTGNLTIVNTQASPDNNKVHEYFAPWTGLGIYNGKQYLTLTDSSFQISALMDSGTSGMFVPDAVYSTLLELFGLPTPGKGKSPNGDCSFEAPSSTILSFTFGGANGGTIEVPATEMLEPMLLDDGSIYTVNGKPQCEFPIFKSGSSSVIFGDIFMRSAYVIFDLDNNLLGLANTNFGAKIDDNGNAKAIPSGGIASIPNAVVATGVTIEPVTSATANIVTSLASAVPTNIQTTFAALPSGLAAASSKAAAAGPVSAPLGTTGLWAMGVAAAFGCASGVSLLFL